MCVYMYVQVCTYVNPYIFLHMCTYIHTSSTLMYMCVYLLTCVYTYMHVWTHACVSLHTHVRKLPANLLVVSLKLPLLLLG